MKNNFLLLLTILSISTTHATDLGIKTRGGLSNAQHIFTTQEKARVAFLGGSITEMKGWHNMVAESLNKRFPKVEFDFIFGGIGSTDSTMGAFRIEKDIFKNGKVDLLFIESAVNELHNNRKKEEIEKGVEGIIRHAFLHNPEISIVAQYFYDARYLTKSKKGETAWQIDTIDQLSQYYNISSINQIVRLKEALTQQVITQKQFGGVHPKPAGHTLYTKNINRLFDLALIKGKLTKKTLPKALNKFNYENGHYLNVKDITLSEGWNFIPKWKAKLGNARRQFNNIPIIQSSIPGATLKIPFTGTAFGITLPAGPDVGQIAYSVDGKVFKTLDLFTRWSKDLNIPWIYMLETDLTNGKHIMKIRVSSKKNRRSKGTFCRVAYIAVN